VVGVDFANRGKAPARRFEIAICKPGDAVKLRPEPKNPADPRAIAVYSQRDVQLGYITAERAPRIGQLMRLGHVMVAVFQEATRHGAVIRVAFDGEVPLLPKPRPAAYEEKLEGSADWYPDEVWPDE
jgi:hypothetical protein